LFAASIALSSETSSAADQSRKVYDWTVGLGRLPGASHSV
jgi:hypothetical protein